MRAKKGYIILVVSIYLSMMIIFIYYIDKKVYSEEVSLIDVEKINVTSFTYTNDKGEVVVHIDATQNATYLEINDVGYIVDNDELFEILLKYKCKKSKKRYLPCSAEDVVVELSLTENHKPKHILLGNFYIWYESGDKKAYEIIEGEKLLEEILLLVK